MGTRLIALAAVVFGFMSHPAHADEASELAQLVDTCVDAWEAAQVARVQLQRAEELKGQSVTERELETIRLHQRASEQKLALLVTLVENELAHVEFVMNAPLRPAGVNRLMPGRSQILKDLLALLNRSGTSDPVPELEIDSLREDAAVPERRRATWSGRIVLTGRIPDLPPLIAQGAAVKDAVCAEQEIPDESLLVSDEGGLQNVFVYLKRLPFGLQTPFERTESELTTEQCRFVPHAQIVRNRSLIAITNRDPVAANIRINGTSVSLNHTLAAGDRSGIGFVFPRAERLPARVSSDFHGWQSAWILSVDHSFADLTDEQGRFEITGLPTGTFEFVIWHEWAGYLERGYKVQLVEGEVVESDLTYPVGRLEADTQE